jgi:hypothetical protein
MPLTDAREKMGNHVRCPMSDVRYPMKPCEPRSKTCHVS